MTSIRPSSFAFALVLAAVGIWLGMAPAAPGATVIVTNTADSGPGSLREAIGNSAAGDTILFTNTLAGQTIRLTGGGLLVSESLTIDASGLAGGVRIDADGNSRVMEIHNASVILDSLTLTNGRASSAGGGILVDDGSMLIASNCVFSGNAASYGGGIENYSGPMTLNYCTFSGNSATSGNGGGIDNGGPMTLNHCVLSDNSAIGGYGFGGGICNTFYDSETATLNNCAISNNFSVSDGGGISTAAVPGGAMTLNNCVLSGNATANGYGGGVASDYSGALTLNNCTLSGNSSRWSGGGVDNDYWSALALNNCSLSGNSGVRGGGGIESYGPAMLNNCTLAGNSATNGNGGGLCISSGAVALTNTIVAGNTASGDANVSGGFIGANNLIGGDPRLMPLGNYGGPTQTMPPLAGSPAINAGTDSVTNFLATDQRGYPRLFGAHVDIGAVEFRNFVVLNANDSGPGSLRDAIALAPDLVTFTNTLAGQTIHPTSGELLISNSMTIDASALPGGVSIAHGYPLSYRVMEITNATAILDSLTFTNAVFVLFTSGAEGGGMLVDHGSTLIASNCIFGNDEVSGYSRAGGGSGGGLAVEGDATLTGCIFSGNEAGSYGGAIYNNGTLTLNDCVVSDNDVEEYRNGYHYNGGGIYNRGVLTLNNSFLSNNVAGRIIFSHYYQRVPGDGGGIFSSNAQVTLSNCVVADNVASSGGGIESYRGGSLTLNRCIISGNSATNGYGNGGGIDAEGVSLTLNDCTFSGNSATSGDGGGIDAEGVSLTLNDCDISSNGCAWNGGGICLGPGRGTDVLSNCTISGNISGFGGGIGNSVALGAPALMLNNCTIADNSATNGSGGGIETSGTLIINNCTISGNFTTNVFGWNSGDGISHGFITALTNTIVAGNTPGNIAILGQFSGANNLIGGDPRLMPLGNHGGPTQTMPPLPGSPAIDAGTDSVTNFLATDQRGYPRLFGAHVDIGAVELRNPVVLNANDSGPGSLRQAIALAPELVTFTNTLAGQTILLTSGELFVSNSMTIDASALPGGASIASPRFGVPAHRVMEITNATAILDSLTLTNGEAYNGGGILVDGGSTLIASNCIFSGNSAFDRYYPFGPGIGGAICGSPLTTVTLVGCTLSGNEANSFGGAVYDFPLATVTLTGCTLSGNKANSSGGAIFVDFPPATVTLTGCTLSGNAANSAGGAIDNNGTLTLNDCVLSDNVARQQFGYRYGPPGNGGGIYNHGALTLNNCILSDNSATSYLGFGAGGGICSVGLPATLNNCTLSGNTASAGGGIEASGTLTLNNCTLFDNTAGNGGGIASSIFFGSTNVLTLNNCTLSGNSATNFGVPFIQGFGSFGGYGGGIDTYGPASLNNCTLSGNSSGTNGGGIYADDAALNNCTISGNHSYYGGGIGGHVLGITNTIVAGNTPGNIAIFGQFSGANNLIGGDPRLMPLGNHGGPTQTMPPLPGSPAIDAGADSVTNFLATDQRGYPRLSGAHVDIGAVEVQFVPAPANSPPVITGAFWAYAGESNAFQFTFTNVLDADFTALASTNMALPLADWTVLGNIPEISPGEYQFTDWNATNSAQCFYRVVSP